MKTARALAALLGWIVGGVVIILAVGHETYWLAAAVFALLFAHAVYEVVAFEVGKRRARAVYEAAEKAATRHLVGDETTATPADLHLIRVNRRAHYTAVARRSA